MVAWKSVYYLLVNAVDAALLTNAEVGLPTE